MDKLNTLGTKGSASKPSQDLFFICVVFVFVFVLYFKGSFNAQIQTWFKVFHNLLLLLSVQKTQ